MDERALAKRSMVFGGIMFLVGLVITVGSYSAAGNDGGRYMVAWGAILFGAFRFIYGFVKLTTSNRS